MEIPTHVVKYSSRLSYPGRQLPPPIHLLDANLRQMAGSITPEFETINKCQS